MWRLKIILKIIFSRLNIPYSFWKKINIFKHGQMENFDYSRKIFEGHFKDLTQINKIYNPVIMEIGPGDSLFSMVYSRKYSKEKFYFLDVGSFANKDISLYLNLQKILEKSNYFSLKLKSNYTSFDEILEFYNSEYLINGIESMKKLKENSVDYIFSHSVLEHVRKYELNDFIKEMYRVLKPNGVISHNINYKDHLNESLNNLRFSEKLWESNFFASSGFYTNRIPAFLMHEYFRNNGFNIIKENFGKWDSLPIKRSALSQEFKNFTDEELMRPTSNFFAIK